MKIPLGFRGNFGKKHATLLRVSPAQARSKRVVRSDFSGDAAVSAARRWWNAARLVLVMGLVAGRWSTAQAASCAVPADREVNAALAEIERSADPCGETTAVRDVLREYRRCAGSGLRICADRRSERNFIERAPIDTRGEPTTITWNPVLRSELEWGCDGDPDKAVRRDPVASLLHELVHAVQDCAGLDPAEHELEAVRIENIYRRARGLCQRTRYGTQRLPDVMRVSCEPGNCRCATAGRFAAAEPVPAAAPRTANGHAGDTAR